MLVEAECDPGAGRGCAARRSRTSSKFRNPGFAEFSAWDVDLLPVNAGPVPGGVSIAPGMVTSRAGDSTDRRPPFTWWSGLSSPGVSRAPVVRTFLLGMAVFGSIQPADAAGTFFSPAIALAGVAWMCGCAVAAVRVAAFKGGAVMTSRLGPMGAGSGKPLSGSPEASGTVTVRTRMGV